jgi:hypothetical protein
VQGHAGFGLRALFAAIPCSFTPLHPREEWSARARHGTRVPGTCQARVRHQRRQLGTRPVKAMDGSARVREPRGRRAVPEYFSRVDQELHRKRALGAYEDNADGVRHVPGTCQAPAASRAGTRTSMSPIPTRWQRSSRRAKIEFSEPLTDTDNGSRGFELKDADGSCCFRSSSFMSPRSNLGFLHF